MAAIRRHARGLRSVLLAVRTGYLQRGYATRLKKALLQQARDAGVTEVVSEVHFDNDAILSLNRRLGASLVRQAADPDYFFCVIRL